MGEGESKGKRRNTHGLEVNEAGASLTQCLSCPQMMQGWNVHQTELDTSSWSWKKEEHLLPGVCRSWNEVGLAGAGTNLCVQKLELEEGRGSITHAESQGTATQCPQWSKRCLGLWVT